MKKYSAYHFLMAVTIVPLLLSVAWADSVHLKGGGVVSGKYLGGTDTSIDFLVEGRVQRFQVADVESLTFGGKSDASSGAPSTSAVSSSETVSVPAGTQLRVRMIDSIDSNTNKVGDRFQASLDDDLIVKNAFVAPRGTDVYGRLASAKEAGRIEGRSELKLELTGIVINGQTMPITTGDYSVSGKSRGSDTAKKVGGGAALGALIGAIAGGGKGAAIGAGVGAGAGTAVQVATRGQQVHVPSETLLTFSLAQPTMLPIAKPSNR
jgi:hypothetical protein